MIPLASNDNMEFNSLLVEYECILDMQQVVTVHLKKILYLELPWLHLPHSFNTFIVNCNLIATCLFTLTSIAFEMFCLL